MNSEQNVPIPFKEIQISLKLSGKWKLIKLLHNVKCNKMLLF